jgi:hypothetical protein
MPYAAYICSIIHFGQEKENQISLAPEISSISECIGLFEQVAQIYFLEEDESSIS